jgi:hypothetical protein
VLQRPNHHSLEARQVKKLVSTKIMLLMSCENIASRQCEQPTLRERVCVAMYAKLAHTNMGRTVLCTFEIQCCTDAELQQESSCHSSVLLHTCELFEPPVYTCQ